MKYAYNALLTPTEDGTGYYCRVPDLPGCVTTGRDLSDAIYMITDAASIWIVAMEDEGYQIPPASPQSALEIPDGSLCTIILIDTDKYRAELEKDETPVRRKVSIPLWMANKAFDYKLNLSQILQAGIQAQLDARTQALS